MLRLCIWLTWFFARQLYSPLSSFLTGLTTSVELSSENQYLFPGHSTTLFLSHWNPTLVPIWTEQDQVTFSLSSTTGYVGLIPMVGEETGTGTETAKVKEGGDERVRGQSLLLSPQCCSQLHFITSHR